MQEPGGSAEEVSVELPAGLTSQIPHALSAATGAVLCALGYRQYRMHALTLGVAVFAAAAFLAAGAAGFPRLASPAAVVGALLGYACRRPFFYVYVALGGALGGALLGFLAALLFRSSNLPLICGAAAVGGGMINLLDARRVTIAWTSIVGAALIAAASVPWMRASGTPWPSILVFLATALGAMAFQGRTHGELEAPAAEAPSQESRPLLRKAA